MYDFENSIKKDKLIYFIFYIKDANNNGKIYDYYNLKCVLKESIKCHSKCEICKELRDEIENKCKTCKDGYILDSYNENNCVRDVINIGEEMKIK